MPRIPRNYYPSGYYHVMNRGVGREAIFDSDRDKNFYKNLARGIFQDYPIEILAYCIMNNHFHFVIKGDLLDFSKALQRVNLSYAMTYNSRRDRVGHVFQNRFKSEMIDSESYLMAAMRYVHNNPVKAKRVKDPGEYPWSSYGEYFNLGDKNMRFLTTLKGRMEIFGHFEKSPRIFKKYHKGKDSHLFLDIHEDFKERQVEAAVNLIEEYFPEISLDDKEELTSDIYLLYRIVAVMLKKTTLSHQEIADILGLSKSQVGRIAKRNKDKETIHF